MKKELRNILLDALAVDMSAQGYVLNKSRAEFTKRSSDGWNKFQLLFLDRATHWEIVPGLLIRKNQVEDIYHKASYYEKNYQKFTPTIGILVENYTGTSIDSRRELRKPTDVEPCIGELLQQFNAVALPFYERFASIKVLESEINDQNSSGSLITGPIRKGSLGVILASLVNNPDYEMLKEKYREYYNRFSEGFYLREYEGVLKVLESS
ncbi:hypothetical protein F0P96_13370 [Hymenobacter busanensis]|uniref:Uncharacterized protein n=1 Tax=Hymenobacter busanensis TaxID=2607656 RepID=A0A7L4ZWG1_9BACT|nr:hypothetical protein [Hymenobacter busanensis]KAA9332456.1 hypothetical protein F0P96_13370 [Hymenobacter busanensis]QHJ07206.1 hypothetical protein GUY19_07900 [Hymenobacter busanensis]